ncbi:MAG TPA: fumarylacetoacetate hydrolase family protein [Pyrinomonadaceae bacterium]|nr:fumarylacetoacetate hydrolase family protein [Pyrinomonadaceae bacterium]
MRICRYISGTLQAPRYGLLEDNSLRPLLDLNPFGSEIRAGDEVLSLSRVKLLAPVEPSKIVCVGRNYVEHAAELGNAMPEQPLLFLKAPSAVIGHLESIELPPESSQVEHEGELAVVIGRMARRLSDVDDPLAFILGYTCVNDVTARDLQRKDVQFTRAKSFDTFCPVGPYIETEIDPDNVAVTTRVNGAVKQHARTSAMAFSVKYLIKYISHAMTLFPGDLIATGTPAGVSKLGVGNTVEVEIEGIGALRNPVTSVLL